MEQPRLASGIVVNRHASRLAAEVAARCEDATIRIVEGEITQLLIDVCDYLASEQNGLLDALALLEESGDEGVDPALPLRQRFLRQSEVLKAFSDLADRRITRHAVRIGECGPGHSGLHFGVHDSSSVGGDGATEGDSASLPVDGSTDPTEDASPSDMRSGWGS